ncbi:MAG: DEAD/DEAH box helicase, partial [Actinomycetes bacterium]
MPRFDNSASSTRSAPPNRGVKPTRKRPLLADDYLAPLEAVGADNGFVALGVREELAAVLAADNVTEPFPIQTATLPDSIAGRDVLGRGQTGSGKTLAFGLGMLTSLAFRRNDPHQPIGLVMVPTRELAQQVDAVLKPLARQVRLSTQVIAGGLPYAKQLDSLKRAVSILVATPGRLIDLVNKGVLDLSQVQVTVLDEADQMSDMGFMPDMITILDLVKPQGQRMLFSATLDGAVDTLVKRYLDDPIRHEVDSGRATVESMEHHILVVEPKHKDVIISQIGARAGRTIMFARTQLGAERIGAALAQSGVPCGVLHGGMAQRIRTRTLAAFQKMPDAVLVATDVAARGIHVDGISLVVNVDAPTDHKDYLHRAGRTARAGESGTVVTLAFSRQKQAVIGMLARAGVRPTPVFARPMDRDLVKITGAQEPSGEPWISPAVTFQPAPRKGHSTRSFDKPRRPATGGPRRDFDDRSGRSSAPAPHREFDD